MRSLLLGVGIVCLTVSYGSAVRADDDAWLVKTRTAAEAGNADAQNELSLAYSLGHHGLPKDEAEAVKWLQQSAGQGNAEAKALLGMDYLNGTGGVPKDEAQASKLWREAADQGNTDGEAMLGLAYYQGFGVRKDPDEGLRWLRLAAEKGNPQAIGFLQWFHVPLTVKVGK